MKITYHFGGSKVSELVFRINWTILWHRKEEVQDEILEIYKVLIE